MMKERRCEKGEDGEEVVEGRRGLDRFSMGSRKRSVIK